MRFFKRMSNGWKLGLESFKIIAENSNLLLFPLASTGVMFLISVGFFGSLGLLFGFGPEFFEGFLQNEFLGYFLLFGFYLVANFIIIFFNVGLVYNIRRIFRGEEVRFTEAMRYSRSRSGNILSWSILAATVGIVLKMMEDKLGALGRFISNLMGAAWSILSFFVLPVLTYEEVSAVEALKRSGSIMKRKWGEAIGAQFGFGIFVLLGYFLFVLPLGITLMFVHPLFGIATGLMAAFTVHIIVSAAKNIFIAAVYQHLHEEPFGPFDEDKLDDAFGQK